MTPVAVRAAYARAREPRNEAGLSAAWGLDVPGPRLPTLRLPGLPTTRESFLQVPEFVVELGVQSEVFEDGPERLHLVEVQRDVTDVRRERVVDPRCKVGRRSRECLPRPQGVADLHCARFADISVDALEREGDGRHVGEHTRGLEFA